MAAHALEHLGSGCARCDEFGDVVDHSDVVGFLEGTGPVVPIPRRELGDDDPDHEEADRGLDVGTMRDGKPLVGLGEEVVEPQGGAQRGHEAAEAVAQSSHGDDDGDEDQGRRGAREVSSERDQEGCDTEREDEGGDEGDLVSIRAESVHGCLALLWCSQFSTVTVLVEEGLVVCFGPGHCRAQEMASKAWSTVQLPPPGCLES